MSHSKRLKAVSFSFFSRLPTVMIELSLGFLNVPDLLRASAASKDLLQAAIVVLGRDVTRLSFRLIPRHILRKIPVSFVINRLHNLESLQRCIHSLRTTAWQFSVPALV